MPNNNIKYLLIEQIITKIDRGQIEYKIKLEKRLRKDPVYNRRNDNRRFNINELDWSFEGMKGVNKITGMLKKIEKEELKKAFPSNADDNMQQQFPIDLRSLNDLELCKIGSIGGLVCRIHYILNYISERQIQIQEHEDSIKSKEGKYGYNKRKCEEISKKKNILMGIKEQHLPFLNDDIKVRKLLRKIKKEKEIKDSLRPIVERRALSDPFQIFCSLNPERLFEEQIQEYGKILECTRSQMKIIKDEINKEKNEFEKVKTCIDPLNNRERKQYDTLIELLLQSNLCNTKYLERYYKFKNYKKNLNRPLLWKKTCKELFDLKGRLDSLSLKNKHCTSRSIDNNKTVDACFCL